jgi:hypothetical protein
VVPWTSIALLAGDANTSRWPSAVMLTPFSKVIEPDRSVPTVLYAERTNPGDMRAMKPADWSRPIASSSWRPTLRS